MKTLFSFIVLLCLLGAATGASGKTSDTKAGQLEQLPRNYQQFKHQFMSGENFSYRPPRGYRGNSDFTMLYVSGGVLAVTGTLAYINGHHNNAGFFSPDNTGLIIGGSLSATILLTKFLVDRYR